MFASIFRLGRFFVLGALVAACSDPSLRPDLERQARVNDRIVNGTDTTIEVRPWQISLQVQQQHFCGGSILTPEWIITAQHCIEGQVEDDLRVVAGATNLS